MTARLRILTASFALAAVGAGCAASGSSTTATATPVSSAARDALAGRVLDIMDGDGLPVQDDYVGCLAGRDGRSDSCYGTTSDEPVQTVDGSFSAARGWSGGHCPGTLTVTLGPTIGDLTQSGPVTPVATVSEDPCQ